MSNFTKGPWASRKVGGPAFKNQVLWAIDYNENQEQVVDFVYEESDANLIAAAPEMYAALRDCISVLEVLGGNGNVYKNAKATLAKARGETK